MLKRWQKIALGLLIFAVAAFLASLWLPTEYQICFPNEYTHAKECSQHHLGPFVVSWIGDVIDAHNGLVTAIATVFVAGFTWILYTSSDKMWRITRDALRHTEKSAELQLRAYIFVEEAEFRMDSDGQWAIHIKLKNSRQTPAYDVKFTVERDLSAPRDEATVFPLTDEATIFPSFTFGAQTPNAARLALDEPPLAIPQGPAGWYACSQSKMRAYLWGRIDYITFGKPQWTAFQMVNHFGNVVSFSFCAVGNDSSRQ